MALHVNMVSALRLVAWRTKALTLKMQLTKMH